MDGIQIEVAPVLDLGGVRFNLAGRPWATQGFRCAISGTPGGGKSYLMAVMAEEVHALGLPFAVIDPEGEHRALCALGGVARVAVQGGDVAFDEDWISLSLGLMRKGAGVVVDLSDLPEKEWAMRYGWFAEALLKMQRQTKRPAFLFLEEAHLFAPQKSRKRVAESLAITKQVARRGRKFGLSTVMASQRPADTEKDVLAQANARCFGRVEILADYEAIRRYLPCGVKMRTLRDLDSGEFFLSVSGEFNKVRIRRRRTPDLGSTPRVAYRQRDFLDLVDVVEEVRSELEASSRLRVFSLAGGEE
jgi:DNA helicase HerA-like ATPase